MTATALALTSETTYLLENRETPEPLKDNETRAQAITGTVSLLAGTLIEVGAVIGTNALLHTKEFTFGSYCATIGLIVVSIAGLFPLYFGQDMLVSTCKGTKSGSYSLILKARDCLCNRGTSLE